MADRLTLTRALESSGMQSEAAERVATEIYAAVYDNVATKTDISTLEQRIAMRFEQVERRVDVRFEQVERRIDGIVIRLGTLVVVVAGLLFAALQHWPPSHG